MILALDKETGEKLWEYNVNAPIAQVGPSIGNGMLFVPTDKIQGQSKDTSRGEGVHSCIWTAINKWNNNKYKTLH